MDRRTGTVTIDFRLLFESLPGLYLVLDPSFRIVAVSHAYLKATLTKREEILGRGIFDVFPDNPADKDASGVSNLKASLNRTLATREPDTMAVQKYDVMDPKTQAFQERYWSPMNSPVLDENGQVNYIIHRAEDVTEYVRLRTLGSQQSRVNDELRQHAGRMEAEIYRRAQEIQEANQRLLLAKAQLEKHLAKGALDLDEKSQALVSESEQRQSIEAALKRSEEQLRHAQKMDAIGRLAGGVAHDFNNLLSVVLSYSSELLESPRLDPSERASVEQIELAGERAAALTQSLLTFSRQNVVNLQTQDLNQALNNSLTMLSRVLREDIELRTTKGPGLGHIRADASQIDQVFMNLVVNAQDAMPNGGSISIATANVELDEAYARDHLSVVPGPYVMLSVSDTGTGMDKETQARVFEPFFTTKERGRGTGLGLATVFGIVSSLGGSIWLYSEVGVGTTFRLYFPRVDSVPASPRQNTNAVTEGGNETVLVVEDDPQIREVTCRILRRSGYQVLVAAGPLEALTLVEQIAEPISLLVTDVVMPKLNGAELARRITQKRPEIKVLFVSGYTDDAIVHHGVLAPGVEFLQKPITPQSLTRRVREVLKA